MKTISRQRMWALLLLLLGAAWGCGEATEEAPPPEDGDPPIETAPVRWGSHAVNEDGVLVVDFGELAVGQLEAVTIPLQNVPEGVRPHLTEELPTPFGAAVASEASPGGWLNVLFYLAPVEPGTFEVEGAVAVGDVTLPFRLSGSSPEEKKAPCTTLVFPEELRFTELPAGVSAPPAIGHVRVYAYNTPCHLEGVRVEGDPSFSVEPLQSSVRISSGSSWTVPVSFQAQTGAAASLFLQVDGSEVEIPLGTKDSNECARIESVNPSLTLGLGCGAKPAAEIRNDCGPSLAVTTADTTLAALHVAVAEGSLPPSGDVSVLASLDHPDGWAESADVVLSFENGDRLTFTLEATWDHFEQSKVFQEPHAAFTFPDLFWLHRWPADLNGDEVLDEEDGIEVFVDDVRLPQREPDGSLNWRLNYEDATLNFPPVVQARFPPEARYLFRFPLVCEAIHPHALGR